MAEDSKSPTDSARVRVLVVDDDAVVLWSVQRVLTPGGYSVVTASTGAEALEQLGRSSFDLLLSDVAMPKMTGLELVHTVRRRGLRLPIVLLTGTTDATLDRTARHLGVQAVIRKPFAPADFLRQIERALVGECRSREPAL